MKRDMNLVRAILLEVERVCPEDTLNSEHMNLDGWDKDEIKYHCKLLIENGLLEGQVSNVIGQRIPFSLIVALTWDGHNFLTAYRDENVWKKTLAKFKEFGEAVTLEIVKEVVKRNVF